MLNEIFSDCFAQRRNYLTQVDARIKTLFVSGAIIITLFSGHVYVPLIISFLSLVFLLTVRVPLKIILLRLSAPLGMVTIILFLQILFYGTTPLFEFNILGLHLVGYKEGLLHGLLIMGKVAGIVSLVIFLSMTTPLNKLLHGARSLKVPNTWIEIAMFSYRYIFVLLENALTIRDAQRVRLGYSNLRRSLKSLGELAGSVFIRAYDKSITIYEAMVLRGYRGGNRIYAQERLGLKDGIAASVFCMILIGLLVLNSCGGR